MSDDDVYGADDQPADDCPWCEDYANGLDPEPCEYHGKVETK